ncbi:hypothetical protein JAO76_17915 [Pontibacter sp. BT310]|uniref:Deoxyribose-phosphate aldolase n=1 Tax=Pontibacter populi TaxID=890055 RepID=A0ABS6XG24_9BACT|nr:MULTISPECIES: DUF6503 family protein [Pontibacter]MBJ6120087.1 hypothetical protein [Pontibacter sp. BT310]MBR0572518.1 hypothetical protein [Microvirga sp. STS03]MBW3366940.1 hypothetical protein [Pontibacter populi]
MKYYKRAIFALLFSTTLVVGLASCQQSTSETENEATTQTARATDKAQLIIDQAIKAHGGERFDKMSLSFDFRDRHYTALRNNGSYVYTREFTDSLGQVMDVLNNEGFYREVNGNRVVLSDEKAKAYSNSVNSVIYFALLPFGLNDAVVNKKYMGVANIKGQSYHKIKVTFDQAGGGSDHEDEYLYWIHPDKYTVDYLAYSFSVNEGGMRFREAHNVRNVKGILFADYVNYETVSDTIALEHLVVAFENAGLKKLSDINLENINVNVL